LFTEEKVDFAGKYYTLTNMKGIPKPFQKPHPPIHIHGASKRMLTLAAREADIVGIEPKLRDQADVPLEQKIAWVREAAGERFAQIELCRTALDLWPTDGPIKVLLGGDFPFMLMRIDQIITYLLEQRADLGVSYIQVFDAQMENFAPVVAELAGK
jgi:Luciferase-like monooxygenase